MLYVKVGLFNQNLFFEKKIVYGLQKQLDQGMNCQVTTKNTEKM